MYKDVGAICVNSGKTDVYACVCVYMRVGGTHIWGEVFSVCTRMAAESEI